MAEGQDHLDKELDKALNDLAGGYEPAFEALQQLMDDPLTLSPNLKVGDLVKCVLGCGASAAVGIAGGNAVSFAFCIAQCLKNKANAP